VVTVLISEERLVVCERRGGASAGALNFFGLFSCSSRRFDAKRGGDRDRERDDVGWRKRERVVAFLLFLLLLFRCNCMLSGKSDRLMNTEAFPGRA
jgi:hypothetical protein